MHNTLQSTKFTPLQCQLVKFCICAEFLDTKLSEKSNYEIPEGVPANTLDRIMEIMVNHIPRLNFVYNKLQCVQGFLRRKKET